MNLQQGLAFGLIAATVACFIWGRFRYDVIAVTALLAGVLLGVVPVTSAFDGFRNDITVIIACALVVSAAFARSGVAEAALRPLIPHLKTERTQVPVLAAAVAILSMATKNVGALAILMPIATQVARRTGSSPSRLLMPMAFGALLGGLVTLVGTSPNIIVSQVRVEVTGKPFGMYDYAPVGLGLTAIGLVFLAFAYRMLPASRAPAVSLDAALGTSPYLTEVEVPEGWSSEHRRVADLHALAQGEVTVMALLRDGRRKASPHPNTRVMPGDTLLLEGDHEALDTLIQRARFRLTRADRPVAMEEPTEEVRVIEAVVGGDSLLIGHSAKAADLHRAHGITLLAVSR
jgi:di/tricarboxylate transporter